MVGLFKHWESMLTPCFPLNKASQSSVSLLLEVLDVDDKLLLLLHFIIELEITSVALPEQPFEFAPNGVHP
jgi:hypothetical protein